MLSRTLLLPLILAVAFALRAMVAVGVHHYLTETAHRDFLIPGDADGYWELGRKLSRGDEFAIYDPPRRAMRMPGFPAFLAGATTIVGENFLAIRLILAAVGTAACWLTYRLGCQLFNTNTGLIAAAMTAVSPALAGFSVLILSETLFAALLVASLLLFVKLLRSDFGLRIADCGLRIGSRRSAIAAPSVARPLNVQPSTFNRQLFWGLITGVAIALATYVRPTWLLAGPLLAGLLMFYATDRKQAGLQAGLILAGLLLPLVPWGIRNYLVVGHFVLTTLWVGPSLYDGLNPRATGESDMRFVEDDDLYRRGMSEYEVDRHYRRAARQFAAGHPLRTVQLAAIKLWRFWKPWPNAEQFSRGWQQMAVGAFFVPMLVLAIRGWWVTRRDPWSWILTIGPILYFSAVHAVFVGSLRYRLPAEYPLCVLSAVGIQSWISRREVGDVGDKERGRQGDREVN